MRAMRHAYLLLAVLAAAMTLNWAAEGIWARAAVSFVLLLIAYGMAMFVEGLEDDERRPR